MVGVGEWPSVRAAGSRAVLLQHVLRANEAEHLYDEIKFLSVRVDEAPPLIFAWCNVDAFVRAVQAARTQAGAPGELPLPSDPLELADRVTEQSFKEAVIRYVRVDGAALSLDTTCLPCSLAEAYQVMSRLTELDLDPWTRRVIAAGEPNMLPVGRVYVPQMQGSDALKLVTMPFPNSLWG